MTDLNNSNYYKKFNDYTDELNNKMYCFEVTKCCGYSALVYVYKEQLVNDLYYNIFHHFGCNKIESVYILDKDNNKVLITDYRHNTMKYFIERYTNRENRLLEPIYPLPLPVVYRLYLEDGHIHQEETIQ
jgi:hypothetical protein